MAKKFMYICIGIMALAVTFHIGAEYGKASIVDHTMSGVVAAAKGGGSSYGLLLDSGEVWYYNILTDTWTQDASVPVTLSEIKFWHSAWFVTYSDEIWQRSDGVYSRIGAPPTGPTPTQPTTWGKIKAEWGE